SADLCATRAEGLRNAPRPEVLALNGATRGQSCATRQNQNTWFCAAQRAA
ncbi:hypothetical protein A2U01_0102319, partial [Trifolium medium]|nr:hypothetical protein [Trifolium medium]